MQRMAGVSSGLTAQRPAQSLLNCSEHMETRSATSLLYLGSGCNPCVVML